MRICVILLALMCVCGVVGAGEDPDNPCDCCHECPCPETWVKCEDCPECLTCQPCPKDELRVTIGDDPTETYLLETPSGDKVWVECPCPECKPCPDKPCTRCKARLAYEQARVEYLWDWCSDSLKYKGESPPAPVNPPMRVIEEDFMKFSEYEEKREAGDHVKGPCWCGDMHPAPADLNFGYVDDLSVMEMKPAPRWSFGGGPHGGSDSIGGGLWLTGPKWWKHFTLDYLHIDPEVGGKTKHRVPIRPLVRDDFVFAGWKPCWKNCKP